MASYCIQNSLNSKILGHYPQVKDIQYHCNVWEEPKFIEHVHFQNVNFEPITASAVLYSSSKPTDLISVTGMGFTRKLLLSGKFKKIITRSRKSGLQFFKSPIIHKNKKIEDYWVLNMYEINMEFIDFKNSKIFLMKGISTILKELEVKNYDHFKEIKKEIDKRGYPFNILIDRFSLISNPTDDFFTLLNVEGGVKYLVSEKLKQEIEEAGCTGIEFMPSKLKLTDWLQRGERDKVYGKP